MNPILQHAIERVERPGGSHEGVGRKKTSNITGPEGAGESKISPQMKNETLQMLRLMLKLRRKSLGVPLSHTPDDPTESEIAGAADKLETMMRGSQPKVNIFFQPDNLGALPALWFYRRN